MTTKKPGLEKSHEIISQLWGFLFEIELAIESGDALSAPMSEELTHILDKHMDLVDVIDDGTLEERLRQRKDSEEIYRVQKNLSTHMPANDSELISMLVEALSWVNAFIPRESPIAFPSTRARVDAALEVAKELGYEYEWEEE